MVARTQSRVDHLVRTLAGVALHVTGTAALAFVRRHGVVLESARGPVPNLAEAVVGEPIRRSWWGHRRSHEIFALTRAVRGSRDVLVCRVVGGKITFVHRRLWPALVRLAEWFDPRELAAVREIHTRWGHHEVQLIPFPRWVPADVKRRAHRLTEAKAAALLARCCGIPLRLGRVARS